MLTPEDEERIRQIADDEDRKMLPGCGCVCFIWLCILTGIVLKLMKNGGLL